MDNAIKPRMDISIINLTILECKFNTKLYFLLKEIDNKSNHIGM